MEQGSLSAAIYWVNMLANNIEPPTIVQGCIFENGCEHHIKKLMKSMVEDAKNKSAQVEKDVSLQKPKTTKLPFHDNNNSKFNCNGHDLSNISFLEENYRKVSQRINFKSEPKNEIIKQDECGRSPLNIDLVWPTEKPVMFGLGPVDDHERRTSLTKLDISFSDDEFTLGPELKKMLTALVE